MHADIGDAKILLPPSIERGSVIHVRALLVHPMHTGLFRDAQGMPIAADFVTEVVVSYGEEQIARFEWTSGISRDPYVAFPLEAIREQPLTVVWRDNRGRVFQTSAEIKFG